MNLNDDIILRLETLKANMEAKRVLLNRDALQLRVQAETLEICVMDLGITIDQIKQAIEEDSK